MVYMKKKKNNQRNNQCVYTERFNYIQKQQTKNRKGIILVINIAETKKHVAAGLDRYVNIIKV